MTDFLNGFPRVPLAHLPTPLEKLSRLSAHLGGPEIWIKRDDCTGLSTGGNKARKLEFLIGEALEKGHKAVATLGATQSNHARQTAAVAARHGLDCYLALENGNQFDSPDYMVNGNVLLDELHGAQITNCPPGADITAHLAGFVSEQRFADQTYVMPLGGSSAVGALGYVNAATEIVDQSRECGVTFDVIVLATGSAGTQAGLMVGLETLGQDVQVIGVSVKFPIAEMTARVAALAQDTRNLLSFNSMPHTLGIHITDSQIGEGYGLPTAEGVNALRLLARLEGILIDPVYSAKAMAWLITAATAGKFSDAQRVLFLHTGGTSGLFGYAELLPDRPK